MQPSLAIRHSFTIFLGLARIDLQRVFYFRISRSSGRLDLVGVGSSYERSLSKHGLTKFLKLTLVALTTNKSFMGGLGFLALGLDCNDPTITLGTRRCLKGVPLAMDLECEDIEALLDEIGHFALKSQD